MTTMTMRFNDFALPWESAHLEDDKFKRILKRLVALFLLLAFVFPFLPLPEVDRAEAEKVPPTLAKVVIHQAKPAPPPPPPPEPKVAEEKKPVEKKPEPSAQKKAGAAKKKVASMGVGAFSKQLTSLRSTVDVAKLQARNTNISTGAAAKSTRSVLGRDTATKTSGGVSSASMSRDGNGTQLAGRNGVDMGGYGDGYGGGGSGGGGAGGSGNGGGKHRSSVSGGRDMESIRRVFEQHKGAIYAIYNRALRKDPEIKGKYVFHIIIEPDGSISTIKLVSSELSDNKLEQKLLARIRLINFGPDDVAATPVNYKFDFLPG